MRLQSVAARTGRRLVQSAIRQYSVRDGVTIGTGVHIGLGSTLWAPGSLFVGDDVYIGKRCTIEVNGSIGKGSLIANDVGLVGRHDHDHRTIGSSMRHAPWIGELDPESLGPEHSVTVGEDCWIGFRSVVLSGIVVGRGAVVAAGSVVTKDVPPYAIVVGSPARVVGSRFDAEERVRHEALLRRALVRGW